MPKKFYNIGLWTQNHGLGIVGLVSRGLVGWWAGGLVAGGLVGWWAGWLEGWRAGGLEPTRVKYSTGAPL